MSGEPTDPSPGRGRAGGVASWARERSERARLGGQLAGTLVVALGAEAPHLFTVNHLAGRAERAASLHGTIGAALTLLSGSSSWRA